MRRPAITSTRAERRAGVIALVMVVAGAAGLVVELVPDAPASPRKVASAQLLALGGVVLGGTVVVRVLGLDDEEHDRDDDSSEV